MRKLSGFYCLLFIVLCLFSCKKNSSGQGTDTPGTKLAVYIAKEFEGMDFKDPSSTWCYPRSRESAHFIVFWDKKYGTNDPNSSSVPASYRVDIDDLLVKAESFYRMNVDTLKFAETGKGKSNLDKYKMNIFVFYTDDWIAAGAGQDDIIGALWISPSTVHPVGSVVAHEIGHTFQYQVGCDLGPADHGFRYGFGGNGGNGFWEQTAQWQSYQSYPSEMFTTWDFNEYLKNYHRHILHEDYRYASYFIHSYWADLHGKEFIGRLWREALKPEDPVQAYMRLTNINTEKFNDEIYDQAAKFATWDISSPRQPGASFIGKQLTKFTSTGLGSFRVAADNCPGTTGYNVIPLKLPVAGTTVTIGFKGMPNATGFNTVDAARAGWRYGYVALLNDGKRVYGTMQKNAAGTIDFIVPANCARLWFIVTGAPSVYTPHAWDDNNTNDEQWPYELTFTNTELL